MRFTKKIIFYTVIYILIVPSFFPHIYAAEKKGKLELQSETRSLLTELEEFSYTYQRVNALYTAQEPKNVITYSRRYKKINELIEALTNNLENWIEKIKESKNDKIYRLYTATVQTALFSIYYRPNAYIEFLKTKWSEIQLKEGFSSISGENNIQIPSISYEDTFNDWQIKAEMMKRQAEFHINEALGLDKFGYEARILQAQLLAIEGDAEKALSIFTSLKNDHVSEERPALFYCWEAYYNLKAGNLIEARNNLGMASAVSSPANYPRWANAYLKSLSSRKNDWVEYEFFGFTPLEDIGLESLRMASMEEISKIRNTLIEPLKEIPASPSAALLKTLSKTQNQNILWELDTDRSEENYQKYARIIETCFKSGIILEKCMKQWDQLALKNKSKAYYFLLHKSECALSLLYMTEKANAWLKNQKLTEMLQYRQASNQIEAMKVNYSAKCKQWYIELWATLDKDIKEILSQNPTFLYGMLIDFEFEAIFSSSQSARKKLENLQNECKIRQIEKIKTFSNTQGISTLSYFYAWKSYLDLKEKKYASALKNVNELENDIDLTDWKESQEKLIKLKTILIEK